MPPGVALIADLKVLVATNGTTGVATGTIHRLLLVAVLHLLLETIPTMISEDQLMGPPVASLPSLRLEIDRLRLTQLHGAVTILVTDLNATEETIDHPMGETMEVIAAAETTGEDHQLQGEIVLPADHLPCEALTTTDGRRPTAEVLTLMVVTFKPRLDQTTRRTLLPLPHLPLPAEYV